MEQVSAALLAAGRPVAVPLPAATFHQDSAPTLHVLLPPTVRLESATAEPPPLLRASLAELLPLALPVAAGLQLQTVALDAGGEGRMRVALRFRASASPAALEWLARACACAAAQPGGTAAAVGGELVQWVSLMVLPPARAIVDRYGRFQARHAYMNSSAADPWHRAPAFFGYDADKGDQGMLVDEVRVFMAGGSDESGAAAPLSMAVKQLGQPCPDEIEKLEAYVHETLWAGKDLGGGGDPAHLNPNPNPKPLPNPNRNPNQATPHTSCRTPSTRSEHRVRLRLRLRVRLRLRLRLRVRLRLRLRVRLRLRLRVRLRVELNPIPNP